MHKFSFVQKLRNRIKLKGSCKLDIDKTTKIVGCNIFVKGQDNSITIKDNTVLRNIFINIIGNNCHLFIGKECMIGDNCELTLKESTSLTIKDRSGLSRNIKIQTSDGHPLFQNNQRINHAKDVLIGEDVWIGDSVTILKGVTIGSGSVVGINSTLTKSIGQNVVAAGNPAKVVKSNITWRDKF